MTSLGQEGASSGRQAGGRGRGDKGQRTQEASGYTDGGNGWDAAPEGMQYSTIMRSLPHACVCRQEQKGWCCGMMRAEHLHPVSTRADQAEECCRAWEAITNGRCAGCRRGGLMHCGVHMGAAGANAIHISFVQNAMRATYQEDCGLCERPTIFKVAVNRVGAGPHLPAFSLAATFVPRPPAGATATARHATRWYRQCAF